MMNPTEHQKEKILDPHVYYLIQQLTSLFEIDPFPWDILALCNAKVESVAINSRNLLYFFETETKDRRKDDVLSADFGFDAKKIGIGTELRMRVGKEVAHLTYSRIEHYRENRRAWPYDEFVPPILERAAAFIDHLLRENRLPKDQLPNWVHLKTNAERLAAEIRNSNKSARRLNLTSTASTTTSPVVVIDTV